MQYAMRSELCHPIHRLLILGSTVRVPRGFDTYIIQITLLKAL